MKGKWSQRQGLGEHTCIRQCTTGAEKGGGDVCGTQECDRTASPALTSDAVRSGAVLPCSGGPEHQATGAFPQPTDNTHGASHRLTELSEENGDTRSRKEIRLTPFFNTHRPLRSNPQSARLKVMRIRSSKAVTIAPHGTQTPDLSFHISH